MRDNNRDALSCLRIQACVQNNKKSPAEGVTLMNEKQSRKAHVPL